MRIVESTGTLFIGNAMRAFKPGDVALIESNVPHVWLNDKDYYAGNDKLRAYSQVIKFKVVFGGGEFAQLPEMKTINELLLNSSRGFGWKAS